MDNKKEIKISEIDELKLIYYEIINGSSYVPENSLFIKHFSEREAYLIQKKRIELFYFYVKEGVPHESELLKSAIENGDWSKEKEDKILELKYAVSDNEKNLNNIIEQQRPFIKKIIDKHKEDLSSLEFEKKSILGTNIEDLIDNDINDFISFLCFFKDERCKISAFESYEAFEKIDFIDVLKLNKIISSNYQKISELTIKKIATMPFFLNKFSYSKENVGSFLGIPINDLTYNQINLFSNGIRNLNVLSNTSSPPPDLNLEAKPDDLVNWYDVQYSILISKSKESK